MSQELITICCVYFRCIPADHERFIEQNILEKFNPGARQLINAGKSYLKALHGNDHHHHQLLVGCTSEFMDSSEDFFKKCGNVAEFF